MNEIWKSPLFGIVLSIAAYALAQFLYRKCKTPILNPLMVSIALIVVFLCTANIPLEDFNIGGDCISMFLAPATAVLAVSIYRQIHILKANCLPIVIGCLAGSVTSMGSIYLLCQLFGLTDSLTSSLLPKSVTTPIAMEISAGRGGVVSITVAAVVITGIFGAVLAPFLIKLFRVKNPVAAGVAIGASSHALGTSKAIEIGEIEGAMSGIAIGVTGIITVILSMILS